MATDNPYLQDIQDSPEVQTNPKDSGNWRILADFVKSKGFSYGSGFDPTGKNHNKGSLHYTGDALDVRIGGKSQAQIEQLMSDAQAAGFHVRDERTHPAGQEKWGGAHIHLSFKFQGNTDPNSNPYLQDLNGDQNPYQDAHDHIASLGQAQASTNPYLQDIQKTPDAKLSPQDANLWKQPSRFDSLPDAPDSKGAFAGATPGAQLGHKPTMADGASAGAQLGAGLGKVAPKPMAGLKKAAQQPYMDARDYASKNKTTPIPMGGNSAPKGQTAGDAFVGAANNINPAAGLVARLFSPVVDAIQQAKQMTPEERNATLQEMGTGYADAARQQTYQSVHPVAVATKDISTYLGSRNKGKGSSLLPGKEIAQLTNLSDPNYNDPKSFSPRRVVEKTIDSLDPIHLIDMAAAGTGAADTLLSPDQTDLQIKNNGKAFKDGLKAFIRNPAFETFKFLGGFDDETLKKFAEGDVQAAEKVVSGTLTVMAMALPVHEIMGEIAHGTPKTVGNLFKDAEAAGLRGGVLHERMLNESKNLDVANPGKTPGNFDIPGLTRQGVLINDKPYIAPDARPTSPVEGAVPVPEVHPELAKLAQNRMTAAIAHAVKIYQLDTPDHLSDGLIDNVAKVISDETGVPADVVKKGVVNAQILHANGDLQRLADSGTRDFDNSFKSFHPGDLPATPSGGPIADVLAAADAKYPGDWERFQNVTDHVYEKYGDTRTGAEALQSLIDNNITDVNVAAKTLDRFFPESDASHAPSVDAQLNHFKNNFMFHPELEDWATKGKPDKNAFFPNEKSYFGERLRLALQDHLNDPSKPVDVAGAHPTPESTVKMYRDLMGRNPQVDIAGKTHDVKLVKGQLQATPTVGAPKTLPAYAKEGVALAQEHHKGNLSARPPGFENVDTSGAMDSPMDAKKVNQVPRIGVDPKSNGRGVKKLSHILRDISTALDRKVFVGKPSRKALGTYYPGSAAAVIRSAGDLDVVAHELAHAIDDKHPDLVSKWVKDKTSPFDAELRQDVFQQTTRPHYKVWQKRAEGVAEFVAAWVKNPAEAERLAPNFAAHFKSVVPEDVLKSLTSFSDDIRNHASLDAHQQVMANVDWHPPKSGLLNMIAESKRGGPGFHLTFADKMQAAIQDNLKAFTKATNFARETLGVPYLLPENDPVILARLYNGIHGKMDDIFERGMIDAKGNRVTDGGIEWLFEHLHNKDAGQLQQEIKEVATYMIAQRTIEKSKQGITHGISGIGAGLEKDVDVANKVIADIFKDDNVVPGPDDAKISADGQFKTYMSKRVRYDATVDRYRQWADANLRYMVEKGRMSQEMYDYIKANNEHYVAMQRVMEISPGEELSTFKGKGSGKGVGTKKDIVFEFKGSTKEIINPYESLMDATYKAVQEADRNAIMKEFRDLLHEPRGMYEGDVKELASVGRLAKTGEKNTIPIYVNGELEHWQFDPDVFAALKRLNEGMYKFPKLVTFFPRLLRSSVVHSPPFVIRNWIRDTFHRSVITDTGKTFNKLGAPSVFEAGRWWKRGEVSDIQKFGGDQGGHYMHTREDYSKEMKKAIVKLAADKGSIVVDPAKWTAAQALKLKDGYQNLLSASERAGRLAEYRTAFKHAKTVLKLDDYNSHLYAASKSRDLLDFAVTGTQMAWINQLIPFSNASIQGLTRTIKAMELESVKVGKVNIPVPTKNSIRFGVQFATNIMLPTFAVMAWNDFVGATEEYQALPAYQRDMFWNIKMGDDLWLRIPKPFEVGVAASGIDRLVSHYAYGEKHALDGYGPDAIKSLAPFDVQSTLGPMQTFFESAANYDFFRNKQIVPDKENDLNLNLRKGTTKASRLGQAVQKVVGVDARKADFVIRGTTAMAGDLAEKASNWGRSPADGGGGLSPLDLTGVFASDPVYSSKDVQWVLETARGTNTVDKLKVLNAAIERYFKATTNADRASTGKAVRELAANIRERWDANPPRHTKKIK